MTHQIKALLHPISRPVLEWCYTLLGHYAPKRMIDIRYRSIYQSRINWEHPVNIDEKINWQQLYADTTAWTRLADKYRVREYIEACGLGHILVKLYGKWDHAEDIDWDSLPRQFVMKVNNGSGDVLVCKDKSSLVTEKETRKFKKLLRKHFGYSTGELHYSHMKPCIIAEELLDVSQQAAPSTSLIDYKIWAFDGKPAYIWACHNRTADSVEVGTYDLDWQFHPEYSVETPHYRLSKQPLPRPSSLQEMIEIAKTLSKGMPQVRIDLYEVNGRPYFGEMTFTSNAGFNNFYTDDFRKELGRRTIL